MLQCPACFTFVTEQESLCPSCGAVPNSSRRATIEPQRPPFRIDKNFHEARFVTGTLIAGRYRIVGLLGLGGMGEVYRAEDLKLQQAVALKFLPEALAGDAAALARFHQEVRVARQVSHANVCRVFDIGEIEGQHFLSMVLATVMTVLVGILRMFFPMTYNFSARYAADFLPDLVIIIALLAFAFHVSLAGRRLFGKLLPD